MKHIALLFTLMGCGISCSYFSKPKGPNCEEFVVSLLNREGYAGNLTQALEAAKKQGASVVHRAPENDLEKTAPTIKVMKIEGEVSGKDPGRWIIAGLQPWEKTEKPLYFAGTTDRRPTKQYYQNYWFEVDGSRCKLQRIEIKTRVGAKAEEVNTQELKQADCENALKGSADELVKSVCSNAKPYF